MDKTARKFSIVRILLMEAFSVERGQFVVQVWTLRQIARKVGLQPTQYLRSLLDELSNEHAISIQEGIAPNGTLRYEYSVLSTVTDSEKYHEPFAKYFYAQGW